MGHASHEGSGERRVIAAQGWRASMLAALWGTQGASAGLCGCWRPAPAAMGPCPQARPRLFDQHGAGAVRGAHPCRADVGHPPSAVRETGRHARGEATSSDDTVQTGLGSHPARDTRPYGAGATRSGPSSTGLHPNRGGCAMRQLWRVPGSVWSLGSAIILTRLLARNQVRLWQGRTKHGPIRDRAETRASARHPCRGTAAAFDGNRIATAMPNE
ncbi:hypothetical protein FHR88_001211 [Bradyrhizobium betae]|nr:hypothetical protein [Bradyrhizobium betae]